MYVPVIKNKLNELKGLGSVSPDKSCVPLFELVDCKYDGFEKFMDMIFDKTNGYLAKNSCMIDLPTYLGNDVRNMFGIDTQDKTISFFKKMRKYFSDGGMTPFTPVVSFSYDYATKRESLKENIKLFRSMTDNFEKIALRLFSDYSMRVEDANLSTQIFAFFGDELKERCTIIADTDKHTMQDAFELIRDLHRDDLIKDVILIGEPFSHREREDTKHKCKLVKNKHMKRIKYFSKQLRGLNISYGDFTLVDKIQTKLEIDQDQGFAFYPFINYTKNTGDICRFSAPERGNYKQYKDLCREVVSLPEFVESHCETCRFIKDVADGKIEKFKSGGTWKHRMIAHHITTMATMFK